MIGDRTKDNTGDNSIANHNAIPNASFNTQSTIIDTKGFRNIKRDATTPCPRLFIKGQNKITVTINPIPPTKILGHIQLIINLLFILTLPKNFEVS